MSIDDEDQRIDLCTKVEVDIADRLVTVKSVEKKIKRLKKGRSPGIDGFTAEHLISLTQAGRGQLVIKQKILEQYVLFIRKMVASKLTDHQNQALNSIKLAGVPKDSHECRPIMMYPIHTKLAFSLFTSSILKKRIDKDLFKHQYGSKLSGAETIIHALQQTIIQRPSFDLFSADAIKAFYNYK